MSGFQSKRLSTQSKLEENTTMTNPNRAEMQVLDADIKTACTMYMQQAQAKGADAGKTIAEVLAILMALATQLSTIIMTKDGFIRLADYSHDANAKSETPSVH